MARTNKGVNFVLKNPKRDDSPIKAIFCYSNQQFYYYEKKLSIPTKYWNKNTKRVKETKSFPGYTEINSTLNIIQTTILSCYRKFLNDNNREPKPDELRILVKETRGLIPSNTPLDFFHFIEMFIEDAKAGKHLNLASGKPVSKVTIRTYEQTFKLLQEYARHKSIKVNFDDIDTMFHKRFIYFLTKEYKSRETNNCLKINTVGKHLTNIKTFMGIALERKLTENNSIRSKSFQVIHEKVYNITLSEDEIDELMNLDLKGNKRLENVRDMFIIGCYTALRISDLKRLGPGHLIKYRDGMFIEIEMKKTEKPVTIPVNEKIISLLEKNKSETGSYFPKSISDQKANEYIKEVAKKLDILNKEVSISETVDGARVSKSVPKYELITNHTARRSFATNAALRGISYQAIMPITGHRTEKAFLRYINIDGIDAARLFKKQLTVPYLKAV